MNSSDLHVFFLPFLSPGHMIPLVEIAKLFSIRNVKVTIVTTEYNVPLIQQSIEKHPIQLLTIETSSSIQNVTQLPTPAVTPEFVDTIDSLQQPFQSLVTLHKPDFIVSDVFYPWTSDLGIPRLLFCGSNAFCVMVSAIIAIHKLSEAVQGDDVPFVITGMPHHIEMTKSNLMVIEDVNGLAGRMNESWAKCFGMVINSVYGFEKEYIDMLMLRSWAVGPVSTCNEDKQIREVNRKEEGISGSIVEWLDRKRKGSVLYVCFGSLGRFSHAQLQEIGLSLVESGFPFLWVLKGSENPKAWMPEGYDEEKGMVVSGWVPQIRILNHASVGGFMTHCGWNSCMEGACAGLPMVTWPLFSDQFYNERLLVDVMRIGVPVGSKVNGFDEGKRTFVKSEEVRRAVVEVMDGGEEGEERRMRAKEAAKVAKEAVEEGGSSYKEMDRLVKELTEHKLNGNK